MSTVDERVDDALAALGHPAGSEREDNDFWVTVEADSDLARVKLSCRSCAWAYTVGEIELWELVVDAREHYEDKHHAA